MVVYVLQASCAITIRGETLLVDADLHFVREVLADPIVRSHTVLTYRAPTDNTFGSELFETRAFHDLEVAVRARFGTGKCENAMCERPSTTLDRPSTIVGTANNAVSLILLTHTCPRATDVLFLPLVVWADALGVGASRSLHPLRVSLAGLPRHIRHTRHLHWLVAMLPQALPVRHAVAPIVERVFAPLERGVVIDGCNVVMPILLWPGDMPELNDWMLLYSVKGVWGELFLAGEK
jgi:hypothetical protein